jgi:hypothetical protein
LNLITQGIIEQLLKSEAVAEMTDQNIAQFVFALQKQLQFD